MEPPGDMRHARAHGRFAATLHASFDHYQTPERRLELREGGRSISRACHSGALKRSGGEPGIEQSAAEVYWIPGSPHQSRPEPTLAGTLPTSAKAEVGGPPE